jgi:hypothetical protein
MSINAKKILITTEKHEVWIIRHGDGRIPFRYCPSCGREVDADDLDAEVSRPGSDRHLNTKTSEENSLRRT